MLRLPHIMTSSVWTRHANSCPSYVSARLADFVKPADNALAVSAPTAEAGQCMSTAPGACRPHSTGTTPSRRGTKGQTMQPGLATRGRCQPRQSATNASRPRLVGAIGALQGSLSQRYRQTAVSQGRLRKMAYRASNPKTGPTAQDHAEDSASHLAAPNMCPDSPVMASAATTAVIVTETRSAGGGSRFDSLAHRQQRCTLRARPEDDGA